MTLNELLDYLLPYREEFGAADVTIIWDECWDHHPILGIDTEYVAGPDPEHPEIGQFCFKDYMMNGYWVMI